MGRQIGQHTGCSVSRSGQPRSETVLLFSYFLFVKAAFCSRCLWCDNLVFTFIISLIYTYFSHYSFQKLILICYHCHAWKTICIWYFLVNFTHPVPYDFYFCGVLQKCYILNSSVIALSRLLFSLLQPIGCEHKKTLYSKHGQHISTQLFFKTKICLPASNYILWIYCFLHMASWWKALLCHFAKSIVMSAWSNISGSETQLSPLSDNGYKYEKFVVSS